MVFAASSDTPSSFKPHVYISTIARNHFCCFVASQTSWACSRGPDRNFPKIFDLSSQALDLSPASESAGLTGGNGGQQPLETVGERVGQVIQLGGPELPDFLGQRA